MLAAIVTVMFLLLMPTKSLFINSFPILNAYVAPNKLWIAFGVLLTPL